MAKGAVDKDADGIDELFRMDKDQDAEVIDVYGDDARGDDHGQKQEGAHTRTLPGPGEPTEGQKQDHAPGSLLRTGHKRADVASTSRTSLASRSTEGPPQRVVGDVL